MKGQKGYETMNQQDNEGIRIVAVLDTARPGLSRTFRPGSILTEEPKPAGPVEVPTAEAELTGGTR